MSTVAQLLLTLGGPIARQVMISLGFTLVTFVGVDLAVSGMLDAARNSWAGMGSDVAAYVAMSGANTGLSIIAGAIVGRMTMLSLKSYRLL
jgi:Protein of unknown function (DUF2523)